MSLYILQQPRTLESIAIVALGDWIIAQGKKFEEATSILHQHDRPAADAVLSRYIENLRSRLECNVPWVSYDRLSKIVLQKYLDLYYKFGLSSISYVTTRMIETLMTKKLTTLKLSYFDWNNYRGSLCSKSYLLTRLLAFELEVLPDNCDQRKETDIIQIIKELPSLKYLSLKYFCTDNILKCAATNCKSIEKLNLKLAFLLNDESIKILTEFPNLTSVELNEKFISLNGIAYLLMNCKNIKQISHPLAATIQHISSSKSAIKQLNIKRYSTDHHTLEQLQLIVEKCPFIEEIKLETSFYSYNNVMPLTGFQHLQKLQLDGHEFYNDQVKEMLEVRGYNLTHLSLNDISEVDVNALIHISQSCPDLQVLSIHLCEFTENMTLLSKKIEIPPFRNLRELSVNSSSGSFDDGTPTTVDEHILFLLSNCLNIETLYIGERVAHTEEALLKILDENPLLFLTKLEIVIPEDVSRKQTKTKVIIDRIVDKCINYPEAIKHTGCNYRRSTYNIF